MVVSNLMTSSVVSTLMHANHYLSLVGVADLRAAVQDTVIDAMKGEHTLPTPPTQYACVYYTHTHTHTCTCTYTHMHPHTHTCTHIHTHTLNSASQSKHICMHVQSCCTYTLSHDTTCWVYYNHVHLNITL